MSGRITSMARFDEDVPESSVVAACEWCGGEIYAGDDVYRASIDSWCSGYVHADCAKEYAFERTFDENGVITAQLEIE